MVCAMDLVWRALLHNQKPTIVRVYLNITIGSSVINIAVNTMLSKE